MTIKFRNMQGRILFATVLILLAGTVFISGCTSGSGTKNQEKSYSMNEDVKVDDFTYRVTKAEEFTAMGTSIYKKETQGKFIKVYLTITNNAKETKQMFSPTFNIEDNQGRSYDKLSDDMMYIGDYIEFGKQLQPGLSASGAAVFELPKDSMSLKLVIQGGVFSTTKVKVALATITDIGRDTTQIEKQNKMMQGLSSGGY